MCAAVADPEMQWQFCSKTTLSAGGQMVQQSARVLPEGKGGAFLPWFLC